MLRFLHGRSLYIVIALLLIGSASYLLFSLGNKDDARVVTKVDEGLVRQMVAVSGSIKAENTAELGFPTSGTIKTVHVRKGDTVAKGDSLITLDGLSLSAAVSDAQAAVQTAKAERAQLLAGASNESRTVSNENVSLRESLLARNTNDEAIKVANALRLLRSNDLTAYSKKADETATPPTITGSYDCDTEGTYVVSVYSSGAPSGYSMRISGLESGTFPVSTDQDIAFGSCGLRARFTLGSSYHNTVWYIDIPNKTSPTYTANKNAYDLAVTNAKSTISAAEQALSLAKAESANTIAPARSEALARANAVVAQAEAKLLKAQATYNDSTLYAPFAGIVVELTAVPGESVTTLPVITLVASDHYELTARIPEIDIGKLHVGQKAEVIFDANINITLAATIDYIAPSATLIDGVAYYEARLALSEVPTWLRSGLNADVDIIVNETTSLRLPKRFVTDTNGVYSVLVPTGDDSVATSTINVTLMGNDGYAAITGLDRGATVIAPE